jgi:hypothetical protein
MQVVVALLDIAAPAVPALLPAQVVRVVAATVAPLEETTKAKTEPLTRAVAVAALIMKARSTTRLRPAAPVS